MRFLETASLFPVAGSLTEKHVTGMPIDAAVELVRLVVIHDFMSLRVTGRPDPASWLGGYTPP